MKSPLEKALLSLTRSTLHPKSKLRQIIPRQIEYRKSIPLDLTGDLIGVFKIGVFKNRGADRQPVTFISWLTALSLKDTDPDSQLVKRPFE